MASTYSNVLSKEELEYLNTHPDVLVAKASLDAKPSGMVYFSLAITDSIRATLQERFGLDVTGSIPMRWIKGDTAPHVDVGASQFQHTYLLYLNDSPGEIVIDSQRYPIQANSGFIFNEGISHETLHTENVPRLLLGPMNELAEPVGAGFNMSYYPTEADALAYQNPLGYFNGYTVGDGGPYGGYTSWRLASNSTGSSSQAVVYVNGDTLNPADSYFLYPAAPCFLEGTTVLCQVDGVEQYIPVETLTKGTLVKTCLHGYKPLFLLGKGTIHNPGTDDRTEHRLYKCSTSKYPQLTQDLFITGSHSILEFPITEKQKKDTIHHLGELFVTEKKYRLIACVDERAEPWNSEGTYTIWHFALEHENERKNYGVYVNGGLLVESCSIHFLKNKSNMVCDI